jgi:hypothetical protein
VEKSPKEVEAEQNRVLEGEGRDQDRSWDQFMIAAKPDSPIFQTGPSSFFTLRLEEAREDYCAQDGSITSLVSSRSHA